MDGDAGLREGILRMINEKTTLKQLVYDNTFNVFTELKEVLHEMSAELNEATEELDRRIKIEYRDRGKFEAQIQVGGDVLVFTMHTNAFTFPEGHAVWQNPYVADRGNAYCGIINIYNFLSDSFKYNRNADEGYLIGRVYINHQMKYFVEGSRQRGVHAEGFGSRALDRAEMLGIVTSAVEYALDFDMLIPPYDLVKVVTVDQLNTKFESTKMESGKRLGYDFSIEEI